MMPACHIRAGAAWEPCVGTGCQYGTVNIVCEKLVRAQKRTRKGKQEHRGRNPSVSGCLTVRSLEALLASAPPTSDGTCILQRSHFQSVTAMA